MSKKDYILIAEIVFTIANPDTRNAIASAFASKLAKANPAFNRAIFMKACGIITSKDL